MHKLIDTHFLLRFAVAVILLFHSIPGMFDGGIAGFGTYLDASGFAPLGLALAWIIKLSHVVGAILLLLNKYVVWAASAFIIVLLVGIFMVHLPHGWYVVGGGENGIEFNFLLICVLLTIIFDQRPRKTI